MAISDHSKIIRPRIVELRGTMATCAVAAMIGALFAGSTVVTPIYVIYKQQFGFSQISLTLIYAAYVVGNLAALLLVGPLSDQIGRRRTAVIAMAIAIASAAIFLFARGIACALRRTNSERVSYRHRRRDRNSVARRTDRKGRQVSRHRHCDQHEFSRPRNWRADLRYVGGIRIFIRCDFPLSSIS
jgi:Major Facilitator Superfamily